MKRRCGGAASGNVGRRKVIWALSKTGMRGALLDVSTGESILNVQKS